MHNELHKGLKDIVVYFVPSSRTLWLIPNK
jgi:hypothetical protein